MSTIALVEQTRIVRYNLKNRLRQIGYTVYDFDTLDHLLMEPYVVKHCDLLLVCTTDTGHDSFEMLKRLQQNESTPAASIFLISADSTSDFLKNVAELGVVDYVVRPFYIDDVIERIRRFLPVSIITMPVEELLEVEISRARRGNYQLSVLFLEIDDKDNRHSFSLKMKMMRDLKRDCREILRSIDLAVQNPSSMMIILPLTTKEGVLTVSRKITEHIQLNTHNYPLKVRLTAVTFPDECKNHHEFLALAKQRVSGTSSNLD